MNELKKRIIEQESDDFLMELGDAERREWLEDC